MKIKSLAPFRTSKELEASKLLRQMENRIVDRLYYNRNKSLSFNLGLPKSTNNKLSPIRIKDSEEDSSYQLTKNANNISINPTQNNQNPNNIKINDIKKNVTMKYKNIRLNDFNGFLEKLSNYENKKTTKKK